MIVSIIDAESPGAQVRFFLFAKTQGKIKTVVVRHPEIIAACINIDVHLCGGIIVIRHRQ